MNSILTMLMKYITSIWSTLALVVILIGIRIADPQILEQIRLISFDNYQNTHLGFLLAYAIVL